MSKEKLPNDLSYPDVMNSVLTHGLGLLKYLKLDGELDKKGLLIKNKKVSLCKSVETEALVFLNQHISKYKPFQVPEATVIVYDFLKPRKEKIAFEASHYFHQLSIAVKILTKKQCRCVYHFSYNKSIDPIKFYAPFDFIEDNRLLDGFRDTSILKNVSEIKKLNKLYSSLVTLPFNNGYDHNRLLNGVIYLDKAQDEVWIHLKVTLFYIALESLFSTDNSEIIYKVALRVSSFLYPATREKDKKQYVFELVRAGYDLRSRFVHGKKVDFSYITKKLKKDEKEYLAEFDFMEELNIVVSDVLNKILSNKFYFDLFSKGKDQDMEIFFAKLIM